MRVLMQIAAAAAVLLVAVYYLLASIPFAYYHFLQFPHFWWMPLFIRFHPAVMAAGVTGLVLAHRLDGHSQAARRLGLTGALLTGWMGVTVFVPELQSYENAAAMNLAALVLLGAAGAAALATAPPGQAEEDAKDANAMGSAIAAAGLASVTYLALGLTGPAASYGSRREAAIVLAASLGGHVAVFAVVTAALVSLAWLARRLRLRGPARTLVLGIAAGLALGLILWRSLLTALTLSDGRALAVACVTGVGLVLHAWAVVTRRSAGASRGVPRLPIGDRWLVAVTLLLVPLTAAILPRALVLADWGFALQKLLVLTTWGLWFAMVHTLSARARRRAAWAAAAAVAAIAAAMLAPRGAAGSATASAAPARPFDPALAIERRAATDTSLMILLDLARSATTDRDFFGALRRAGDATDDPALPARRLHVADPLGPAPEPPPHIFVIVIDSLRPDYLSAYNPAVDFTPRIGEFARESLVMQKAFTPYTGTALSQPALWAGGLIQRAMYIKPFALVNNLERLLSANGYRQYVSIDEILSTVVDDRSRITRLDGHLANPEREDQAFKFDLCTTVDELRTKLDADAGDPAPVFFYTQPQNMHIRVLAPDSLPGSTPAQAAPPGFFAPAAAVLRRLDGCFGRFIDDLKARGLYEHSIVVLTSDHGDAYGEEGRWGHAFYMTPETLRIPIVMHVPMALRTRFVAHEDGVVLATDIVPTLYKLLGYDGLSSNPLVGRPFVSRPGEPWAGASRDTLLVQSSYSRIFGLLDGQGRYLYVANANESKEQFLRWSQAGVEARTLGAAERIGYRRALFEALERLNAHYVPAGAGTK